MHALSIPPPSSTSSSLILLLFLLLSLLLPHPVLPTRVLADVKGIVGELQTHALTGQIFKESSSSMNPPRVELHEVKTGANPISNSLTVSWPANP